MLLAEDGAASEQYGWVVAVDGDRAVVGVPFADGPAGVDAGAAYVYERSGTSWTQVSRITASDARFFDGFGSAVSLSGQSVLVGAPGDDVGQENTGSAYVFVRGGSSWFQQQQLLSSDPDRHDRFGHAVSLSGDTTTDSFKYSISDGDGGAAGGNVTVTIQGQNDAPAAKPDAENTTETTPVTVDVLANDSDVDGDDSPANFSLDSINSVTVSGVNVDPNLVTGSVTIAANQVSFDPGRDFDELAVGQSATVTVGYAMSDDSNAPCSVLGAEDCVPHPLSGSGLSTLDSRLCP